MNNNSQPAHHKSVLVQEVIHYLNPQPHKIYVDVTFGVGGHTRAILEHEPTCTVVAFDWDQAALEKYGQPLQQEFGDRLKLVWGNFSLLIKLLKKERIPKIDGLLADFGTSQVQIMTRAGFSVYRDTPLDMRMSPSHHQQTAAEVVRTASLSELCDIFWHLADEHKAKKIAQAIIEARKIKPILTTGQLADIVEQATPERRGHRIHPATKVFQALRIYVNKELDNINSLLHGALHVLAHGGTLVCISFHSLEDRMVKQFFKEQEMKGELTVLTPKGIVASEQEIAQNSSARSARLRAACRGQNSV